MEQAGRKNLIIAIIAIIVVGAGIYYFTYYRNQNGQANKDTEKYSSFEVIGIDGGVFSLKKQNSENEKMNIQFSKNASVQYQDGGLKKEINIGDIIILSEDRYSESENKIIADWAVVFKNIKQPPEDGVAPPPPAQ